MSLDAQIRGPGTPVLWLRTDEASGNLTNSGSGAGAAWTARGTPTYRVTKIFGYSTGVGLAGGSNYFSRSSGVLAGDVNFSIACWFRTTSTDATASYTGADVANVVVGDWSNSVMRAFGVHGGVLKYRHFQNSGGVWGGATGTAAVNNGIWNLAGVTYTASTDAVVLYLNGVQEATGTIGANTSGASFTTFGAGYGNGTEAAAADFFDGDLAVPVGWSTVLTATEFRRIYEAGLQGAVSY